MTHRPSTPPSLRRRRAPRVASAAVVLAVASLATSCSLALNFDETQCAKDDDCAKRNFPAGAVCQNNVCVSNATTTGSAGTSSSTGMAIPGFECLGNFQYPDTGGMPVKQTFYFEDAGTGNPVAMGAIKGNVCSPLTGDCTTPTQSGLVPDAMGNLELDVPMLPSYYDFKTTDMGMGGSAAMQKDIRPGLAYESKPIVNPPHTKTIRVISYENFVALAGIVKATEDPTHAIALVLTVDCNDNRAAGVQISVDQDATDSSTVAAYFKGQLPKLGETQTDSEGAFAMVNLPVGAGGAPKAITFTAKLAATGQQIGTATAFLRKGYISYVHIGPTPNGQ